MPRTSKWTKSRAPYTSQDRDAYGEANNERGGRRIPEKGMEPRPSRSNTEPHTRIQQEATPEDEFGMDRDPGIMMYLSKAPQWNTTTLTDNCIVNPTLTKRTQVQDQYLLQLPFLTDQHIRHPFSYP